MSDFQASATGYSNLFTLKIAKDAVAYRYHVDVDGISFKGVRKSFTTHQDTGKPVYASYEKSAALYQLLNFAFATMNWPISAVYDNCSTLYTPKPLPGVLEKAFELICSPNDVRQKFFNGLNQIVLCLTPVAVLDLDDPRHLQADNFGMLDESLTSFLELLTTQPLIDFNGFDKTNLRTIVSPTIVKKDDYGINFSLEVVKGVNLCQRNDGKEGAEVKVGVDVRVSAYYQSGSFNNILRRYMTYYPAGSESPYNDVVRVFKGVQLYRIYNQGRRLRFNGFTTNSINDNVIQTDNGSEITHEEYFKQKYGLEIDGSLRGVKVGSGSNALIVPVEALIIAPYQRFPSERYAAVSPDFQTQLLKENVMKPEVRKSRIDTVVNYLYDANIFFEKFGVQIVENSNRIAFNICYPPNAGDKPGQNGKFQAMRYANAGKARSIVVVFHPSVSKAVLQQFTTQLYDYAKRKGVIFPQSNPQYEIFDNQGANIEQWYELFDRLKVVNPSIVIYVDKKNHNSHGLLKFMEHEYDILTQHLCLETISKRVGGQTLENILNKINEKLGGTNYRIRPSLNSKFSMEQDNTFFIGYDVAHPTSKPSEAQQARMLGLRSLHPSTVGISANCAKGLYSFIGNYFYQQSRSEAVDGHMLKDTVKSLLRIRAANRPTSNTPEYVFVLRDGVSEGQYRMVIQYEFPFIRKAFEEFNIECQNVDTDEPKFVVMIVTKRHMKRFFSNRGGNVDINSCLEAGAAKANAQAYLTVSARPIMGTAKPPEYTVLHDDTDSDVDVLRATAHSLCSAHQIITAPVGLPEPVFVADELAKRGNNNLKVTIDHFGDRLPLDDNGCYDVDELNRHLTYSTNQLIYQHFNA